MAIIFTQGHSVLIGMLVAYWFTMLPGGLRSAPLLQWQFCHVIVVQIPGVPLKFF